MGQIKNIKLHIVTDIKSDHHTNMKLFKDIFTEKDVITDAFKMELVDDLYYKITGTYVKEDNAIDGSLIGANASEEAAEGDDAADEVQIVANILSSTKLEEIPTIGTKDEYKQKMKASMKKLLEKVKETNEARADFLKEQLTPKFVIPTLKGFKKYRFYATEDDEYELEGGIIHFEGLDDPKAGQPCYMYVLKDSVISESC